MGQIPKLQMWNTSSPIVPRTADRFEHIGASRRPDGVNGKWYSRVLASPPSASWSRSRGRVCGCEISQAERPSDGRASRLAGRSVYGPRASPQPHDAAVNRQASAALAPVPGPQPRPRDAAAAPSAAAHPRLRPPRPHLRSPADRPAEDRRPPRRGAVAAHGSVAVISR